ncbi:DUF6221 family protein [Phycicoccus sp. Soil802]|uniref:DUF6221 family protein n=1 Tax=Phycicoccus sp. Soil802 TaxID=1736414 RepID=UPI0012F802C3|nr:DUF6221 family protein [Phycicoccus sp. Soil802]
MTITEFLQARITEQEIRCRALLEAELMPVAVRQSVSLALAACEAKRRIVEVHEGYFPDGQDPSWELLSLASAYSRHPDWNCKWAP